MVVHLKVCLPVYTHTGDLEVDNAWIYTPVGSPKNKEIVYTPMGGSPTINVMVYTHFRVSTKLKV